MLTLQELTKQIEKKISDYIEFDVNEIFNLSDYITIYGGAVRDSIAGLEIHDIDILCMPTSAQKLLFFLREQRGYDSLDLYDPDSLNMYHGLSLISDPWTLMNKNRKIIQIIRPRYYGTLGKSTEEEYRDAYVNLLKNVDLSCCGVFLEHTDPRLESKKLMLKESCKNGIVHCLSKTFQINEWAKLYTPDRTAFRDQKLSSRGWYNIGSKPFFRTEKDFIRSERRLKIATLEFKIEEDYKIWTEEEYHTRPRTMSFNNDDWDDLPF